MSEISAPPLPPPSALFSSSSSSLFALSHPNPSTTGNRTSRRAGGTFSLPVVLSTPVPARLQDPGFRGRAKPALEAALSKDHLDQEDILLAKGREAEGKGSSAISRRNTVHTSSSCSLQPQLNAHNLSRPTFHHASSSPILPGASSRRNQSPPTLRSPLSSPPRSSTLRVLTTSSSSLLLLSSHLASSPVIERAISPPSPGILLCSSPSSPTNFTPTKIIRNSAAASNESSVPSSPVAYTSSLITERPSSTSRILPLTPSPTIESPSSPTDLRDSYFTDPTASPISPPPPRKAKPSPALSIALPPPTLVGSATWMEGHVDTPIVEVDQEEMILCALEEKTAGLGLDFGGLSVGEEGTATTKTGLGLGGQSLFSSGGSSNFGTGKEDAGKEARESDSGTDEEGDVEG